MPYTAMLLLWRQFLRILYLWLVVLRLLVWILLASFLIHFWCLYRWLRLVALLVGFISRLWLVGWLRLPVCHGCCAEDADTKDTCHNRPCQYSQNRRDAT